jgi:hypothetical protein
LSLSVSQSPIAKHHLERVTIVKTELLWRPENEEQLWLRENEKTLPQYVCGRWSHAASWRRDGDQHGPAEKVEQWGLK